MSQHATTGDGMLTGLHLLAEMAAKYFHREAMFVTAESDLGIRVMYDNPRDVGADRVVIGSDGYAPMDVAEPNGLVEQLRLPAQDRDRILWGNASRLFRL